jgi:hypothetical protein
LGQGTLDGLPAPFAELAIYSVLKHGTMEWTGVTECLRVEHKKAGFPGVGNGRLGLVANDLEDISYVKRRGDFLGNSKDVFKTLFVHIQTIS